MRVRRIGHLLLLVITLTGHAASGWQFNIDGATDEAGPCHIDGCGYQREGASSLDVLPSGDILVGGSFRELSYRGGQADHNVASAGVARVATAGLGSEVWRHSPLVVPAIYTQPDPFFPQGECHLGGIPFVAALPDGDALVVADPCKRFPGPRSVVVSRLDGTTGAVEWTYGPDFGGGPVDLAVHSGRVFLPYEGDRVVALDASDGSVLWTRTSASLGMSVNRPLAVTSGGDVVVTGTTSGPVVQRLSAVDGTTLWSYALTPVTNAIITDMAITTGDDVVAVGGVSGGDNGDFGVVKIAGAGGAELWRYATRGSSTDPGAGNVASAVVVDAAGNVFAGGLLTVAGHPIRPAGNADAAVIKVSNAGAHQWTRTFDSGGDHPDESVEDGGLALDSAGNVIALLDLYTQVGPGSQGRDPAMARLDSATGNTLWLRRPTDVGAPAEDPSWVEIYRLRVDANDVAVAVGSIFSQRLVEWDYDGVVWRVWPNGSQTPCFDGVVDPGEACDDGNAINGDGCDRNCTVSACGNGIAAGGEQCDDGNAANGDGCDVDCTFSVCGNGEVGGSETCDDGDLGDGDGCDGNCTASACGNGIVAGAEACDDGNQIAGDGCDPNCTLPACGNGVVAGGEACDDGNLVNGDGCESNCTIAGCGNGSVAGGETCDDGNLASGDGCDANCVPTACGNGIVTAGELCDDGNLASGDGCDATCRPSGCGSGVITGGELCDDGNTIDGDGCDATCRPSGCGSGAVTAGEQCDDGNLVDGDGCEASCQYTVVTVAESVGPGGTVSTDSIGGATAAFPAQASVTTPTGGDVSITKSAQVAPPADGFGTLGMVIQIDAPPAASPAAPLQISLDLDASLLPPGATPATLAVFKDGVQVPDCTGAPGVAAPDPCVGTRDPLPGGDVRLVVLTTTASAWALAAPTHDAVVRSPKPLAVALDGAPVTKALKVQVLNGDAKQNPLQQTVRLSASSDCPGSTLSVPDFDPDTPGAQDTVTLAPGKKGKPALALTVNPGGVSGINGKAPRRCGITLEATLVAPSAGVEIRPANNTATIDVDLVDSGDAALATAHETALGRLKPLKLKLGDGDVAVSKVIKLSMVNADVLPAPESGHTVTLTADDGTCPPGTLTAVDADAGVAGEQASVTVAGGGKATATVTVNASAAAFASGSSKAPDRCVALLTATGPGGEADLANDTARLVIDVFDQNDY